jgi:hypothetical protein
LAKVAGRDDRFMTSVTQKAISTARVDLSPEHRQPAGWRVVLSAVAAILASIVADAVVVAIGEAIFPATKGYTHFRFADYAKLTVIGVIIACAAWPIITRVTSAPRWLFLRLAVVVTLVLWLPDLYLLYRGQPTKAVAVLMIMHVAIAVVTYQLLVRGAPPRPVSRERAVGRQ